MWSYNRETLFTESAHWADSVIELPCLSVCLCVCQCSFFQGLLLALRSHDHFQASLWSSLTPNTGKKKIWYRCFYPHWSSDSVSSVGGIFKVYKSKCPSVCLSVSSLLSYRLAVFLPPLPKVGCPIL